MWTSLPITSQKNMWNDHTTRCDHTISSKWTFDHTKNVLITPSKFWSHRQIFYHTVKFLITLYINCSHRKDFIHTVKKFDHTVKFFDHTVYILFTPFRFYSHHQIFCSHHLFSRSHHHNFVHTIKMLFTHLKISHVWTRQSGVFHFLWYISYCFGMITQIPYGRTCWCDKKCMVWSTTYGVNKMSMVWSEF